MAALLGALLSGLVFGIGLVVSGMINPAKVQNFLDVFGSWDPSLMLVMGGAIPVAALGVILARRRARPLAAASFREAAGGDAIDRDLVLGSVIFGIGWGLVGFCPGPAIAALGLGLPQAALFVASMLLGMGLYELRQSLARRPSTSEA
jgi:uncharacterized protein